MKLLRTAFLEINFADSTRGEFHRVNPVAIQKCIVYFLVKILDFKIFMETQVASSTKLETYFRTYRCISSVESTGI